MNCTVSSCDRTAKARGLCLMHYKRARRRGFGPEPVLDKSNWTDSNIAWSSAIIEGEGNFSFRPSKRAGRVRVRMTDKDVLDKLLDILRVGAIWGPIIRKNPKHKPSWEWSVNKRRHVIEVIKVILPWLCSRRHLAATTILSKLENNNAAHEV